MSSQLLLLMLMSCGAAFVQRVSGFGFGIFIMTVLPYLLPTYGEATTLSGLLAMVTSVLIVARTWRHICWRKLLPILVTFLVVSFFAVRFVAYADPSTSSGQALEGILRKMLGGVLIFAAVWFLWLKERVKLPTTLPVQVGMGTLSGMMGGLFGMQGPPAVLYFVQTNQTKEAYIAMAQTYFLVGNAAMTLFRAHCGLLTTDVLTGWCWAVPAVIVGTWIGSVAFKHISLPRLRMLIYVYMAISGVVALCG